jgi:hypothetical protein
MNACPFCVENSPVEVLGLWVHKFPNRWITCNTRNQDPFSLSNRNSENEARPASACDETNLIATVDLACS